ncbi:MAG: hypothetical protein AB1635_09270 [Acidobacteriota bacterium]
MTATARVIAERSDAGDLSARLIDDHRGPIARLSVARNVEVGGVLRAEFADTPALVSRVRVELEPTLDWAARQLQSLAGEGRRGGPTRWERDLLRVGPGDSRAASEPWVEVTTEWRDGLTSTTRWRRGGRAFEASAVPTAEFTTFLVDGAQSLGWLRWNASSRVLSWAFGVGAPSFVDDQRLAEIGGWPFAVDMAWANVQALAFHQLSASAPSAAAQRPRDGPLDRLWSAVVPTLYAQDGCTGLHWLDGTILRQCCDRHDLCFNRYGCDRYSWFWPFGYAWQCTSCNISAVYCFNTIGDGPYHLTP